MFLSLGIGAVVNYDWYVMNCYVRLYGSPQNARINILDPTLQRNWWTYSDKDNGILVSCKCTSELMLMFITILGFLQ